MIKLLVLDLGSSSTRALAFNEDLMPLPGEISREPLNFISTSPGQSEDDPHQAVARARRVLVKALRQYADLGIRQFDAVAIASYAGSLLALDANSQPIGNVITYADTRAAGHAAALRKVHEEIDNLQRTGCRIRANYAPARLAWLQAHNMADLSRARHLVSMADYVRLELFGELSTSLSLASWNGLINRSTLEWDATWLREFSIATGNTCQFPAINETPLALRGLDPELATLNGALLMPALGDGAAANLGSGCTDSSRIAVTVGTTGAMRIVTDQPPGDLPAALWQYRIDRNHALTGGAMSEGGNIMTWLRQSLNLPDAPALESALQCMPPDTHGLTVLPFIAGERSPGYGDASGATMQGITVGTSALQIVQAWMEAVTFRLAIVCDALRPLADNTAQLFASGGALFNSPTWCQMIADATGIELRLCDEPEATARGVALHALKFLQPGRAAPAAKVGSPFTPNPHTGEIYRAAIDRQSALYTIYNTSQP